MDTKKILPVLFIGAFALSGCGFDIVATQDNPIEVEDMEQDSESYTIEVEDELNVFEEAWLELRANVGTWDDEFAQEMDELAADIDEGVDDIQANLAVLGNATAEEARELRAEIDQQLEELSQDIDQYEERVDEYDANNDMDSEM